MEQRDTQAASSSANKNLDVLSNLRPSEFASIVRAMEQGVNGGMQKSEQYGKELGQEIRDFGSGASAALNCGLHDIYTSVFTDPGQQLRTDAAKVMGGKDSEQYKSFEKGLTAFESTESDLAKHLQAEKPVNGAVLTADQAKAEAEKRVQQAETSMDHLLTATTASGYPQFMSDKTDTPPMSLAERIKLASSFVNEVSHPLDASQGKTSTCQIAAFDKVLYTEHPEKAADLLDKVGTTGSYDYMHGTASESLHLTDLNENANGNNVGAFGTRSYADQILQNAVGQIALNEKLDYAGQPRNQQYVDGGTMANGFNIDGSDQIQRDVYQSLTGEDRQVVYDYKDWKHSASSLKDWQSSHDKATTELELLKKNGQFPLTFGVHGWNADSGNMNGGHQIVVTDYDPKTKNLTVYGSEKKVPEEMARRQCLSTSLSTDIMEFSTTKATGSVNSPSLLDK